LTVKIWHQQRQRPISRAVPTHFDASSDVHIMWNIIFSNIWYDWFRL